MRVSPELVELLDQARQLLFLALLLVDQGAVFEEDTAIHDKGGGQELQQGGLVSQPFEAALDRLLVVLVASFNEVHLFLESSDQLWGGWTIYLPDRVLVYIVRAGRVFHCVHG